MAKNQLQENTEETKIHESKRCEHTQKRKKKENIHKLHNTKNWITLKTLSEWTKKSYKSDDDDDSIEYSSIHIYLRANLTL